ncbi:helix-turn-helix transcriptional regulator [Sphingomonas bacterium]|uniref:helix-turn-helix transcriptional regulator n=1 Tax=Sphingomonas bacterium TaxID=1895847 RepID=UPI00157515BD|nr:helix-turn-helix transcriptional regulator [Sphingomonas bacterium]
MYETLIDRIYECAFVPESWPSVLDDIATIAAARGGALLTADTEVLGWTASDSLVAVWDGLQRHNLMACGERFRRLVGLRHCGFLTDQAGYRDEAEMGEDLLYRDVLWPLGLGWAAATAIPLPTGETMVITFERDRKLGPVGAAAVDQLDILRPHLARSALIATRLRLQRAQAIGAMLAAIGIPALVFDAAGCILAVNPLIEGLEDLVRWEARDRFALVDPAADAILRQAIGSLDAPGNKRKGVRSFAIKARNGAAALVAHIIPVRELARDVFVRGAGVLVLTPVAPVHAPATELVQSLFDLTPSEARIARQLSAGDSVGKIAINADLSVTTIRNQVRAVLAKTGCRRQAEVVALMGGLSNITARSAGYDEALSKAVRRPN